MSSPYYEPAASANIGGCAWSVGETLEDLDGYVIKTPNGSVESAKCGWRDIDRDYNWWCLIQQQAENDPANPSQGMGSACR